MVVGLLPSHVPLGALDGNGVDVEVAVVDDFEAAKRRMAVAPPDVLVTALRLGAYNGLHLVLRGKATRPSMAAIVVADADDPVLRRDAEALGAAFVVGPVTAEHVREALRLGA